MCVPPEGSCVSGPSLQNYLSALLTSGDASQINEIRKIVPKKNDIITASDVMLYTPDINVIIKEKGCECFFMKCYLLELNVYWEENEIVQDPILKDNLEAIEECLEKKSNICSPCEAQPVANISMFSSSLNDTLDYFSTLGNDEDIYCTC
ncbi:interleukin-15 isoform X3 [Alosa pseudoharengus]|uniref:interleukin-15 isoform X3 n=1 Tax=Alosa pseudoharengus TaxID=34774 RepID=UPI003F8C7D20